ncbi:MAG: SprT family zinc-dependent metalloprotease [Opitutales bacterium]
MRDTGDVILSVPDYVSDFSALEFLRSQAAWLIETLGKVPEPPDIEAHLRSQPWISLDGRKAHVMLDESKMRTHWVADPQRGETIIRCVMGANRAEELINALAEMARRYVPERVTALAKKVGARINKVRVRDQRTLWGSCTGDGNLSLNWRIILLPPHLHDHIIYHELAHMRHMDHSPGFYRLLNSYDPEACRNDHSISKLSPVFMAMGR